MYICRTLLLAGKSVFLLLKEVFFMLSDGEYSIQVKLQGGSGRATVKSPTKLTVEKGKMQAEIEWSSSHYDYMEVAEKPYYPVNKEGNALFVIDVAELDKDIPIKAETTAMSTPHTIEYTLHFPSETAEQDNNSNISPMIFLGVGVLLIVLSLAKNRIRKKKNE